MGEGIIKCTQFSIEFEELSHVNNFELKINVSSNGFPSNTIKMFYYRYLKDELELYE